MIMMIPDMLLFLILVKGSVYCCHDVRENCFSGQFGYTDVDNVAISIHLAATNRECSTETRHFCSQYANLKQCIIKHVGSCAANNTIWKQWEAMDSLNYSICSSTNAILSQYEECVQTVEVSQQVSLCYSPLAWNSSTCALVPKRNAPSDQCQNEDQEEIENCLERVVSSKCPGDVGKWLTSHFASSYLSKGCSNDSGDSPADCNINTNAQLMEDVSICRSLYGNGISGLFQIGSPGSQIMEMCRIGRNYVKCKLDRIVAHCGMARAIVDKQRIARTYSTLFHIINCNLDDIDISWHSLPQACTDAEQCGKETTAITFQPELNKTTDSPSSLNRHLVVIVAVPTVCLLVLAIAVPVIIVKGRKGCIDRKQENIIYGVHGSLDSPSISTVSSTNSSNIYSRISENTISESALPKESTVVIEASNP